MGETGKKVLVIDDEENVVKLLESRLKANKYRVMTASNGREGLAYIDKEMPDLIILDVMMPVMDGFEFFKIIKKDPKKSKIPVLVLTARSGMRDTFEAMDVDDFMAKPFEPEIFLEHIDKIFKKKVLLLCDDSGVIDKISKTISADNTLLAIAQTEDEMIHKGRSEKFNSIVAYLGSIKKEPKDFMMFKRMLRNKDVKLIVYSDVKASGSDDSVVVEEIKTKWERAGIDLFFDQVVTPQNFTQVIQRYL